jgi:hypothetical protein
MSKATSMLMTQHKDEAATPQPTSAKAMDWLIQKFNKQRKEIVELMNKYDAQAKLANMEKGPRGKRRGKAQMFIRIEFEKGPHHFDGRVLMNRVLAKHAFLRCAMECAVLADVVSTKARLALKEGRIEDYLNLFAEAERCLGARVAWSEATAIQSLGAARKSKQSRAENDIWKERVLDYWRKHINPTYTADNAAEIIETQYLSKTESGKEISLRTLAKWIRAERKAKTTSPPEVTRIPLRLY